MGSNVRLLRVDAEILRLRLNGKPDPAKLEALEAERRKLIDEITRMQLHRGIDVGKTRHPATSSRKTRISSSGSPSPSAQKTAPGKRASAKNKPKP